MMQLDRVLVPAAGSSTIAEQFGIFLALHSLVILVIAVARA
jgi:hypothetical protein